MTTPRKRKKKASSPARKPRKKETPASPKRRGWVIFKRVFKFLLLTLLLLLGFADWFVHQPREWRDAARAKLGDRLTTTIEDVGDRVAGLTDAIGITGYDVTGPLELFGGGMSTTYGGSPLSTRNDRKTEILTKKTFVVGYNTQLRNPLWVAYRLHEVDEYTLPKRPSRFGPDPDASIVVRHDDYTHSGYDRGHMAPNFAIASRFGNDAQRQTFKTSNISPQKRSLNSGVWRSLENRVAKGYTQWREVTWVITGPLFTDSPERLPSHIAIPSAFYKIVISEKDGDLYVMSFIMPQTTPAGKKPRRFLTSIDEIERQSGLDFLHQLPDELEDDVESRTPTRLWTFGLRGIREAGGAFIARWLPRRATQP